MKHLKHTSRPNVASATPDCMITVVISLATIRITATSAGDKGSWMLNTGNDETLAFGISVDSTC